MRPVDEAGGDAACWAHLFDDPDGDPQFTPVDLPAIATRSHGRGPVWTAASDDLNVNLMHFRAGEGVADHVNTELDVLMIGVAGEGLITINGELHPFGPGQLVLVPKGAVRSARATGDHLAYLTCHRRRAGLVPTVPGVPR
jgi:mannose-6-phosphate isomerase-like protein (cupin superfamily)